MKRSVGQAKLHHFVFNVLKFNGSFFSHGISRQFPGGAPAFEDRPQGGAPRTLHHLRNLPPTFLCNSRVSTTKELRPYYNFPEKKYRQYIFTHENILLNIFFRTYVIPIVLLNVVGRGSATGALCLCYVYSAEVYPTVVRSIGVGSSSFWVRSRYMHTRLDISLFFSPKYVPYILKLQNDWLEQTKTGNNCILKKNQQSWPADYFPNF